MSTTAANAQLQSATDCSTGSLSLLLEDDSETETHSPPKLLAKHRSDVFLSCEYCSPSKNTILEDDRKDDAIAYARALGRDCNRCMVEDDLGSMKRIANLLWHWISVHGIPVITENSQLQKENKELKHAVDDLKQRLVHELEREKTRREEFLKDGMRLVEGNDILRDAWQRAKESNCKMRMELKRTTQRLEKALFELADFKSKYVGDCLFSTAPFAQSYHSPASLRMVEDSTDAQLRALQRNSAEQRDLITELFDYVKTSVATKRDTEARDGEERKDTNILDALAQLTHSTGELMSIQKNALEQSGEVESVRAKDLAKLQQTLEKTQATNKAEMVKVATLLTEQRKALEPVTEEMQRSLSTLAQSATRSARIGKVSREEAYQFHSDLKQSLAEIQAPTDDLLLISQIQSCALTEIKQCTDNIERELAADSSADQKQLKQMTELIQNVARIAEMSEETKESIGDLRADVLDLKLRQSPTETATRSDDTDDAKTECSPHTAIEPTVLGEEIMLLPDERAQSVAIERIAAAKASEDLHNASVVLLSTKLDAMDRKQMQIMQTLVAHQRVAEYRRENIDRALRLCFSGYR